MIDGQDGDHDEFALGGLLGRSDHFFGHMEYLSFNFGWGIRQRQMTCR